VPLLNAAPLLNVPLFALDVPELVALPVPSSNFQLDKAVCGYVLE